MTTIQLKKNLRYFESDDSEFTIQVREQKLLPEKHLRSYSIKYHLFHGLFEVIEGSFLFNMKAGLVYVAKDILYCKEHSKYFKKDLELDTITFIAEDEVPKYILSLLNKNASAELKVEEITEKELPEVAEIVPEGQEIINFNNMTRTELVGYITENNLEIDTEMSIKKIRKALKK
jgi:hypothetical protein